MKIITVFDTSISSANLGDEIIMDSVNKEVELLFPEDHIIRVATHEKVTRMSYPILKQSNLCIVGGTNLFCSNMLMKNQWKIDMLTSIFLKNAVFLGVGARDYKPIDKYSKILYNRVLDKERYVHSLRDEYTKNKLSNIGIQNVVNTNCVTMWNLTEEHCKSITTKKSKNVVCTLTDYHKDPAADRKMIEILKNNYKKVYLWLQGINDYNYIKSLDVDVILISPSLKKYDELLASDEELDYVGTRLHAGIRALQNKRRSIIVGIDNRAREISKDTMLPMVERENLELMPNLINSNFNTALNINFKAISQWRSQFRK